MRQYYVDEISKADIERIKRYLNDHAEASSVEGLYWLNLGPALLSGLQKEHTACQPYCIAIEVGNHFVKFEFLVRSRNRITCQCHAYADPVQREFIIGFAEELLSTLKIRT